MPRTQPDGYLAVLPTGKGSGVLVLHAWWGLNDTMKAFCTRLAESGFVAFAPDLYHGKVADNIAAAETLGKALDANYLQAKAEISNAAMFLNERVGQSDRGLAVIGFSLGAYYALDLSVTAPEHIRSVVIFYGTGVDDFSNSRAAYLGHFAENDEFEPQSNIDDLWKSLKCAGRPVTFYRYTGTGHWFFEPDRSDAYNPAAAGLAWDRTLAFLNAPPAEELFMKKSELLNWLRKEHQQWEAFLDQIGPARMDQPGVNGDWSIKDIVAHLTSWQIRNVASLYAAERSEPEPPPPWPAHLQTEDEINAWIYESNHGRSVSEVLDESHQVFQQTLAAIEGLPDDVRINPENRLVWLDGQCFVAGEFFDHFHDDHEPDIRLWLARVEKQ